MVQSIGAFIRKPMLVVMASLSLGGRNSEGDQTMTDSHERCSADSANEKRCCALAPRCEYHHCRKLARWSIWQPSWGSKDGQPGSFKFMCDQCWNFYREAITSAIPGITRPEGADDQWKPSLMDCIRFARIKIDFEERQEKESVLRSMGSLRRHDDERQYTTEQLKQVMFLRRWHQENDWRTMR